MRIYGQVAEVAERATQFDDPEHAVIWIYEVCSERMQRMLNTLCQYGQMNHRVSFSRCLTSLLWQKI